MQSGSHKHRLPSSKQSEEAADVMHELKFYFSCLHIDLCLGAWAWVGVGMCAYLRVFALCMLLPSRSEPECCSVHWVVDQHHVESHVRKLGLSAVVVNFFKEDI
ncbi:hypothetical protein NDU88_005089 [Pleurodeles waltl]|uniref:Uncharacterized protein n=1 Tax=Pleurodeles waltl TaxID=8319 RepID=A0AAV7VK22_PLEWA|nr:hypothetical protein NDU88_005089 [Pleurodeles waltl]